MRPRAVAFVLLAAVLAGCGSVDERPVNLAGTSPEPSVSTPMTPSSQAPDATVELDPVEPPHAPADAANKNSRDTALGVVCWTRWEFVLLILELTVPVFDGKFAAEKNLDAATSAVLERAIGDLKGASEVVPAEAVPLAIAGVLLAGSGRLITAGSEGANIGGGAAEIFGLPVVAILVGVAINRAVRAVRRERAEKSAKTGTTRPTGSHHGE